jgi:DnaJ family protein C protein 13
VLHAALPFLCGVFADPGARTTDPSLQDAVLQAAAALGRPLFALFNHPATRVADGTAVIMRAIAERGAAAAAPMRDAALREGAILHHLQLALFASGARDGAICTTGLPRACVLSSADQQLGL